MRLTRCREVVFDIPSTSLPYESRYKRLFDYLAVKDTCTIVAARQKCISNSQLSKMLQNILTERGEGLILQLADSLYEHGRSTSLVKLKVI